jgi:GAF domain-containing protein
MVPRDGADPSTKIAPQVSTDPAATTPSDGSRRRSGRQDLDGLFRDVIDRSFTLFGVDEAGLWTYDDSATPLKLAAQRGLSPDVLKIIETLPRDASTQGMEAMRRHEVRIMRGDLSGTVPAVQVIYEHAGIRTVCFVPIVFHGEPLGLLSLYHHRDYAWTEAETELARAFADHMATAIANARLASSTRTLAGRLRVISGSPGA